MSWFIAIMDLDECDVKLIGPMTKEEAESETNLLILRAVECARLNRKMDDEGNDLIHTQAVQAIGLQAYLNQKAPADG